MSRMALVSLFVILPGCGTARIPESSPGTRLPSGLPRLQSQGPGVQSIVNEPSDEEHKPEAPGSYGGPEDLAPIPFVAGADDRLYYWDPASPSAYAVPGAGAGIDSPSFFDENERIAFGQGGLLWVWDRKTETKVEIPGTSDLAPLDDPHMQDGFAEALFNNANDVFLWNRSKPSPVPHVTALAEIHAIGQLHGGIQDTAPDGDFTKVVVLAGDGTLWLYTFAPHSIVQITEATAVGTGVVTDFDLNDPGTELAFTSANHLFVDHLETHTIDPIPYANTALGGRQVSGPTWITDEEFDYSSVGADGTSRFLLYNWKTEKVRTLFGLNSVQGLAACLTPSL